MNRRFERRVIRAGGAPVLVITSPLQITGIAAWYRMDLLVTQAGTVSAWGDSSGTGDANKNLAQATGGKQPTYTATDAAYNNKPTASYASASLQELDSAAWAAALTTPYTIFVVGNYDGVGTSQGLVGDSTGLVQFVFGNGATGINAFSGSFLNYAASDSAAKKVVAAVFGASGSLYDTSKTVKASGSTGTYSLTRAFIGVDAGAHYLNGKIAEVIIYSRALSGSEINAVLNYCALRYAITLT